MNKRESTAMLVIY